MIAVCLHAAAFAFSPTWTVRSLEAGAAGRGGTELVVLGSPDSVSLTAGSMASVTPVPVPAVEAPDAESPPQGSGQVVVDGDDETSDEAALRSAWAAYDDRVRRRGSLTPGLATVPGAARRGNDATPRAPAPAEDDPPDVEVEEPLADVALPEPDSLRLERLGTVRPELALVTTSAWVLIRNQTEIESYLRRSYTEGRLDRSAEGSVSVTLWIDPDGLVEWSEITESSGDQELDEFALALFNDVADFRAARDRGERVSRSVTFSLRFPW